jgi:diguanylate cyclase
LAIQDNIISIDSTLLPQLQSLPLADEAANHLIAALQTEIEEVKFQLSTLFERQLEVENGRDTLTRLLNRRFLPSVMNREIHLAKEKNTSFAVLMLDIDLFKRVNDEYGHEAGDLVLQQSAALVLNTVRNGDFVFRYGGEEILIMLVEVSHDVARRIAETIRQRFEFNYHWPRPPEITVSSVWPILTATPIHTI